MLGLVVEPQFPLSRWVLVPVTMQFAFLFAFARLQFILVTKVAVDVEFEMKGYLSLCEVSKINIFMDSFVDMP